MSHLWSRHPGVGFCTSLRVCMGRIWTTFTIIRGTCRKTQGLKSFPAMNWRLTENTTFFLPLLPRSSAFPKTWSCSEWSYPRRIEPGETSRLQILMKYFSLCERLFFQPNCSRFKRNLIFAVITDIVHAHENGQKLPVLLKVQTLQRGTKEGDTVWIKTDSRAEVSFIHTFKPQNELYCDTTVPQTLSVCQWGVSSALGGCWNEKKITNLYQSHTHREAKRKHCTRKHHFLV